MPSASNSMESEALLASPSQMPSKPLKSQIKELQRALGRAEVPGVPDELARLLAQEKEEGAEDGARKVKEDWGDVDEEAW